MDRIKKLKASDPDFHITDGFTVAARAGFEISSGCPFNYREIVQECVRQGWLKPVAYMKESEYAWERLQQDE